MNPTAARQLCIDLAQNEPQRSLKVARSIDEPWFRCQALASTARYWPGDGYAPILEEALAAARSQINLYKLVAVQAWPLRAYLERNNSGPVSAHLTQATGASQGIENRGGRSEALFMLFQAARPYDTDLWRPVFWMLVDAAEPSISWRQGRSVQYAAEMVFSDHPELIGEMTRQLSDPRNLAAVSRVVNRADAQQASPRPFFGY